MAAGYGRRLLSRDGLRWALGAVVACFGVVSSSDAAAFEFAVDASSQLQLYSVRSPWGAPVLSRQRLIHQLAFDAYGPRPTLTESKATWAFHSRLRLDGDYGIYDEERDTGNRAAFIPGLSASPVDLSYGYFAASGLLRNTTGFALGRQLFFDELGFWSFDGAKVTFAPGRLFELTGYTGFEQRGGVPFLSTSRYEADGVFRGDRSGMTPSSWPGYLNSTKLAPAYGASLALTAFAGVRARIDYRRVNQHDTVVTLPFADANGKLQSFSGSRISSERFGLGLGADIAERASIDGAFVYDLYRRVGQEHRAMLSYRPEKTVRTTLSYQYRLPLFDADSIFNWFGAKGTILSQAGVAWQPSRAFQMTFSGGIRWLGVGPRQLLWSGLDSGPDGGKSGMFRAESTYVLRRDVLGTATSYESGDAGRRVVSDLWHYRDYLNNRLQTRILVSAGHFQHPLIPERAQSSVMYVMGVRLFPGARQELSTEWEHVIAEGPFQRFRVIATATARWP